MAPILELPIGRASSQCCAGSSYQSSDALHSTEGCREHDGSRAPASSTGIRKLDFLMIT